MRNKKEIRFRKARFLESSEALNNPGCGWYHVYPFVIRVPAQLSLEETESSLSDISREEQLVLARIDIGAFRACEIPEEALDAVTRIFDFFHENQKQMIVRFTYDSEGKGMQREPQSMELIKTHMEQLGAVICRFASDILVLQGIFVGSWGEMHHSKFLAASDMSELICSLYRAVKGSCYLAVRTPKQWREITENEKTKPDLKKKLGLFNDGIFGSATDLGTYQEGLRENELKWQERFAASVPNGGEVIADEMPVGYRQAAEEMKSMHLCYLNSSYQKRQLDLWKNERVEEADCWKGLSGYEYIGRHLGSRFLVRDAEVFGDRLEILVENLGFAGLYEETECFLEIEGSTGKMILRNVETIASEWKSEKKIVLSVPLSVIETEEKESKVFLRMKRKKDGRTIRLANQGAEDRVLLGWLKHR